MVPSAVVLRNYRCFASAAEIKLRPLTLLYGINNAGKSALLRALPLLADSVAAEVQSPLDLESAAARGSTYRDLLWKGSGRDDDANLEIVICWPSSQGLPTRLSYQFFWSETEHWTGVQVRQLVIADDGGRHLQADWDPSPEQIDRHRFEWEAPHGGRSHGRLEFTGLLPSTDVGDSGIESLLEGTRQRLECLRHQVQWLGAVRAQPDQSIIKLPASKRMRMKSDGRDAAAVLWTDAAIRDEVSAWYERRIQRRLVVQEVPRHGFKLMLQPLARAELDVELASSGEGMVQVLPVLTGLALVRRHAEGGPRILAVEEPESHLHPRLQRDLAEHLCEVTVGDQGPRVVLETHSHHVLLGVQLAVVSGRLRPEDVALHWVRQLDDGQGVVETVEIDELGQLVGNWPPGVFDDDTELARQIIKERRERRGQRA